MLVKMVSEDDDDDLLKMMTMICCPPFWLYVCSVQLVDGVDLREVDDLRALKLALHVDVRRRFTPPRGAPRGLDIEGQDEQFHERSDGHPAPALCVVGEPLGRPEVRACAKMATVCVWCPRILGVPTVFSEMPKVF